jgi:hypothetical protein
MKIIEITSTIEYNEKGDLTVIPNNLFTSELEKITMATLRKLLIINIVANKSCGFSNNFKARFAFLESSLLNRSFSFGPNEKNATSDPEINAEKINKTKINVR